MERIHYSGGGKSPYVLCDPQNGIIEIKGRSILEDTQSFYISIQEWLDSYLQSPAKSTVVHIDLEYYNSSSSIWLMRILRQIKQLRDDGEDVQVYWHYRDDELFESGEDYSSILNFPFEMVDNTFE